MFDGKNAPGVLKFSERLNFDYQTPWIEGLTLSGCVIYTGDSVFDNLNTREEEGWARLDLGASY